MGNEMNNNENTNTVNPFANLAIVRKFTVSEWIEERVSPYQNSISCNRIWSNKYCAAHIHCEDLRSGCWWRWDIHDEHGHDIVDGKCDTLDAAKIAADIALMNWMKEHGCSLELGAFNQLTAENERLNCLLDHKQNQIDDLIEQMKE